MCKALEFNDSDITWTILNNKGFNVNDYGASFCWNLEDLFVVKRGKDYGYCYPAKNEIWVSTLALRQNLYTLTKTTTCTPFPLWKNDILADVLVDEITHIQTMRDHDDEYYNSKLKENRRKCHLK